MSTTLTVQISPDLEERLAALAEHTRRTKSSLVNEAIAVYVTRELTIIDDIEAGLEDVRAGRVRQHEEVMAKIRTTIAARNGRQ